MDTKAIILKNSIVGLCSQIIALMVQFVMRIFLLQYVGIEIIGINSTFLSVLKTLSLTELGFQTAVVYYLYNPLCKHDTYKINQILKILKRVYEIVSIVFVILTLASIPLLKYILKDVIVTREIISYYILMSLNIAFSYLFAYKRALLLADQKDYVSKIIDSVFNIAICLLNISVLIKFKSYMATLVLQLLQTVASNIFVHIFCKRKYAYLIDCQFDYALFKTILADVKSVFMAKLAGFVYFATDNLIISSFLGTIYVGFLSNYVILVTAIKQIVNAIFNTMTSVIGNMLLGNSSIKQKEAWFNVYSYVRYILASAIVGPWVLLADDIVKILFGEQYILSDSTVILLSIDLYIHIVYSVCCEYINGSGCFAEDKYISIIGAVINIIASLCMVFSMGVEGVLTGTVISQIFFWTGRSVVVYFKIFKLKWQEYKGYVGKNIIWIVCLLCTMIIMFWVQKKVNTSNAYLNIIIIFGLCQGFFFLIQFLFLRKTDEWIALWKCITNVNFHNRTS